MLDRDGGAIIRGILTDAEVAAIKAEPLAELRPGPPNGFEFADMADPHGANTKRPTNLVTLSPTFRLLLEKRMVLALSGVSRTREAGSDSPRAFGAAGQAATTGRLFVGNRIPRCCPES